VFSGNLEYEPNRAAIEYFARRIWPAVAREFGDLEWHLIGRNPDAVRPVVSQSPRVRVVGAIDDAVLELSRYRAAVVPVLFGSGTRFKIIEAWAAGTPVVSTTLGSEGLPVTDGVHLLLADDPQGFVQGLSRILTNSLFGQSLSASGRRLYEERFCWNVVWPTLSNHGI